MRSLQTTRGRAIKAALLAGGAGVIALAHPAVAQDNGQPVTTKEPVACDPAVDKNCTTANDVTAENNGGTNPTGKGIVVTGSRIVKKDYSSNSPIVTVDQGLLQNSSTAAVEDNLNKLPQFEPAKTPTAGGDIQPTATNTPGAATIVAARHRRQPQPRADRRPSRHPEQRRPAWSTSPRSRAPQSSASKSFPAALRRLTVRTRSPASPTSS